MLPALLALLLAAPPSIPPDKAAISRARFIADTDALFRRMDLNSNGQLDRSEIELFQRNQANDAAVARNRTTFAQLDTDKDGKLSQSEFDRFAPPPNTANATPMLTRMDVDRSQSISLTEHRAAMLINFNRLDTDRDGVVSQAEMKAGGLAR